MLDPGLFRCYRTGFGERTPIIGSGAARWSRNQPCPVSPLPPPPPAPLAEGLHNATDGTHGTEIHRSPAVNLIPKLILPSQSTKTTKNHPFLPIFSRSSRGKYSLEHSSFKTRDCLIKLDSFCCMIPLDYHQLIRLKTHGGFGFVH